MNGLAGSVVMALSIAFVGALVEWIARPRSSRRSLFVALGRVRTAADDARARRLRIVNAVVTLGGIALVLSPAPDVVRVAATTVCPLISVGWLLGALVGVVRSAELERVPGRYAVSLDDGPGIGDLVSPPLELVNVLSLLVPSAIYAFLLSRLPARVPMHFAADGTVDRYGSPAELWMMAGLIAFDIALLWVIVVAVAKERWVLPERDAERYASLALERRRLLVRMVEWVMAGVNVGMAVMWLGLAAGGLPGWGAIVGPAIVLSLIVMLIGTVGPLALLMPRLSKVADALRSIAGTEVLGTRSPGWRWGGLIYYAPEDPAVFVPKRIGIGQTLNMARPSAWVFLALVVLVPLAISVVATLAA